MLKKALKNSHFHPRRQQRRKHDPLDPARLHYAFYPPERPHFLGLYPHEGITSACGCTSEILPRLVRRLRERCAFFVTLWILTLHPECHQETVKSSPHSRRTYPRRTCSKRPRPVATNPPNPPKFSNTRM